MPTRHWLSSAIFDRSFGHFDTCTRSVHQLESSHAFTALACEVVAQMRTFLLLVPPYLIA